MANTSFKILSWSDDELITTDKLDDMVSNIEWVRDNMVSGNYAAFNKSKKDGVKIMAGITQITKQGNQSATKQVNFNSFFNPLAKPIVTISAVSSHQRRIFTTLSGIGKPFPDGRGFTAHVYIEAEKAANKKITHDFYISWIAVGW